MPELPEVETIRRDLLGYLDFPSPWQKFHIDDGDFRVKHTNLDRMVIREIISQNVHQVHRHGKKLIFELDAGFVVFHLGMSGQIVSDLQNTFYPEHKKASMLIGQKPLYFIDIRRFGSIWFFREWEKDKIFVGLDPMNQAINGKMLRAMLHSVSPVKVLLMDQTRLAGIGNIYASEILHCAGILPTRPGNSLHEQECEQLALCIRNILRAAIENFGTTFSIFRNMKGQEGKNSAFLKVYGRDGEKCFQCGEKIVKIELGQRSTFYCPVCQR